MPKQGRKVVATPPFAVNVLGMSTKDETTTAVSESSASTDISTQPLSIPLSFDEMIRQSTSAMEDAYKQGVNRQIVRILLPRSADNEQLLQYYEEDAEIGTQQVVLVPPDESWQGGIMQLYRVASLSCREMLR